ncbi:MAG: hypothetical protein ACD_28C00260G0001, partial [uncultured bacterium]
LIRWSFAGAFSVGILLFFLAWFQGELRPSMEKTAYGFTWIITLHRPILFLKSWSILVWDVVLFFLLELSFRLPGSQNVRQHALLGLGICLLLWRIVLNNLGMIALPESASANLGELPDKISVLWFILFLAPMKEWMFRKLQAGCGTAPNPLLLVLSWHHRKDAIFNMLFLLIVWSPSVGIPSITANLGFAFVKVFLLGGASIAITSLCLRILLTTGSRE